MISTEVDEFVQTELPQIVIFFEESRWYHIKHALAAEDLCLNIAQEYSPKECKDYE